MTSSCWLELGDLLVMDGQCQDDFIHCTNPVSEQERINVTFSSIRQHATSCSLLRVGVFFANVCEGFIRPFSGVGGERCVLGILGAPGYSVYLEGASFAGLSLMSTGSGLRRCACRWTLSAEVGGGIIFVARWEFTNALGESGIVVHTTMVFC